MRYLIILVCVTGCATQPGPIECATLDARTELADVALQFVGPPRADGPHIGSTVIYDGGLMTSRHLLPRFAWEGVTVGDVSGRPVVHGSLNGQPIDFQVHDSGQGDDLADDWAVLHLEEAVSSPLDVMFDFECELLPGEELLLIGFWTNHPDVIRVTVIEPPEDVPPGIVCIDAPHQRTYCGMSGGPAVKWDPEHRRITVVGIYRGMIDEGEFVGLVLDPGTHTLVRPPL